MQFTIGTRDELNTRAAGLNAKVWRTALQRHPKACFFNIAGYDDDPRELWEFPEVCRYVRRWARLAGMDDIEHTARVLGVGSPLGEQALLHLQLLAAFGVFGEEYKTGDAKASCELTS